MAVKSIGQLYGFVSVNDALRAEGRKEAEATIAKLQAESAAEREAYKARIKELEALLAQKG